MSACRASPIVEQPRGRLRSADAVAKGSQGTATLPIDGFDHSEKDISVDSRMRTSNPKVYAPGDRAESIQLAGVADHEARVAARNILADINDGRGTEITYDTVPAVSFTYPQYGMVGATEDSLKEKGIPYRKNAAKSLRWPTYRRVGMADAGFKVLADDSGRILGAHILSDDDAAGLLGLFRSAMINGTAVGDLYWQSMTTPYPSRESDIIYMLKPLLDT